MPSLNWGSTCLALFAVAEGGYCSTSDDLSYSLNVKNIYEETCIYHWDPSTKQDSGKWKTIVEDLKKQVKEAKALLEKEREKNIRMDKEMRKYEEQLKEQSNVRGLLEKVNCISIIDSSL